MEPNSSPRRVLFVCTGNTCRSVMAEAYLKAKLDRDRLSLSVHVHSAGLHAVEGAPASPHAILTMAHRGLDIRAHRGHKLQQSDIVQADLVLVMTQEHKEVIRRGFPGSEGKVHLLRDMAGQTGEVDDPYGGSLLAYEYCADEIASLMEEGYTTILQHLCTERRR